VWKSKEPLIGRARPKVAFIDGDECNVDDEEEVQQV
jgi:hypothetical protein